MNGDVAELWKRADHTTHCIRVALGDADMKSADAGEPQRGDLTVGDDAAAAEHRDTISHALNLTQHMRTQQHRLPGRTRLAHHPQELALHERIEAVGGFIQDQQLGVVRLHDAGLLAVALRERAHRSPQVEAEAVGEVIDSTRCDRTTDLGEIVQQRPSPHASAQAQVTGQVPATMAPRLARG